MCYSFITVDFHSLQNTSIQCHIKLSHDCRKGLSPNRNLRRTEVLVTCEVVFNYPLDLLFWFLVHLALESWCWYIGITVRQMAATGPACIAICRSMTTDCMDIGKGKSQVQLRSLSDSLHKLTLRLLFLIRTALYLVLIIWHILTNLIFTTIIWEWNFCHHFTAKKYEGSRLLEVLHHKQQSEYQVL